MPTDVVSRSADANSVETRSVEAIRLRHVMGHFATGVAVITAHDGSGPIGFTCQSVVSVSLDPPLLSFCPARTSTSWPALRDVGQLCVNILADDQDALCRQFARSGTDKFAGVEWTAAGNGAPALRGALAHVEGAIEFEHDAGDHTIVLLRVSNLHADADASPLLFFKGRFGTFE